MMKLRNKSGVRKGMKRYARRKARGVTSSISGRYLLSNDVTRAQVEFYDQIALATGGNSCIFATTSASYYNITAILANSTSFQDLYPIYARYKITGFSVRCSIAHSLDVICTNIATGAPSCSAAFYPNLTSTSLGNTPCFNDHKMMVEPGVTSVQSKFWKFPDNYFDASGTGFGVWSQCNGYTNQVGQVSFTCNKTPAPAVAATYLFNVRLTLYVLLSDKNR